MFTTVTNLLHGGKYTDVMVMYRAYKTDLVYKLGLYEDDAHKLPEKLFGTRISWEPLLSARAARYRLKVGEIPGDEPARIGGERKLQMWRWGAAYMFQIVIELFLPKRPVVK